jgi:hypothetical protein
MLFFTRVQWETFLGSTNPALGSLPLLVIVLYGMAWICRREILKYPLILILNFLAIYTGYGLFLGFVTPVLLALDVCQTARTSGHMPWLPVVACFVSVASIISFFAGYVRDPDCIAFIHSHPISYVAFVATMFSGFLAVRGFYFSRVSGSLLLAILIVIAVIQFKRLFLTSANTRNLNRIVLTLITFSLFGRCEKKSRIAPIDRLIGEVMSQEPYISARRVFWIMDNSRRLTPVQIRHRNSEREYLAKAC